MRGNDHNQLPSPPSPPHATLICTWNTNTGAVRTSRPCQWQASCNGFSTSAFTVYDASSNTVMPVVVLGYCNRKNGLQLSFARFAAQVLRRPYPSRCQYTNKAKQQPNPSSTPFAVLVHVVLTLANQRRRRATFTKIRPKFHSIFHVPSFAYLHLNIQANSFLLDGDEASFFIGCRLAKFHVVG